MHDEFAVTVQGESRSTVTMDWGLGEIAASEIALYRILRSHGASREQIRDAKNRLRENAATSIEVVEPTTERR